MAKSSGIRALKNLKNKIGQKKPTVKTQRVVVSKKISADAGKKDSLSERGDADGFLEETPTAGYADADKTTDKLTDETAERTDEKAVEAEEASKITDEKAAEAEEASKITDEKTAEAEETSERTDEKAAEAEKAAEGTAPKNAGERSVARPVQSMRSSRSRRNKKGFASRTLNSLASVFIKKKDPGAKNEDALAFASNNKRLGKKGRRNRMILLYSGTGAVVIAVILIIFLAPGSVAAPAETQTGAKAALIESVDNTQSPTPTATEEPSATSSEITKAAALGPDATGTETVSASPTVIPTTEPTEEPTPVATTEPDPTPTPIDINELVDYFVVKADAYYNEMGYSNNHYDYTDNELYMLAQIIDCEAGGESYEGKVAVGNVVMNRVLCRTFPGSTISDVITRSGQFAYNSNRKPSSSSKRAARAILDDELWVIPQDIYYFRSGAAAGVNWGSHKFYIKIGGHCFYKHSYSGRHRGGDAPPALFERTFKYAQYGCKPEKRVYRIQYMLNKLGYDVYADSYFGKDTKVALMEFQEKKGLEADGIAGPSTVKALIKEYGLEKYYKKFCA